MLKEKKKLSVFVIHLPPRITHAQTDKAKTNLHLPLFTRQRQSIALKKNQLQFFKKEKKQLKVKTSNTPPKPARTLISSHVPLQNFIFKKGALPWLSSSRFVFWKLTNESGVCSREIFVFGMVMYKVGFQCIFGNFWSLIRRVLITFKVLVSQD